MRAALSTSLFRTIVPDVDPSALQERPGSFVPAPATRRRVEQPIVASLLTTEKRVFWDYIVTVLELVGGAPAQGWGSVFFSQASVFTQLLAFGSLCSILYSMLCSHELSSHNS